MEREDLSKDARYVTVKILGQGACGRVLLLRDMKTNEDFAIKVLEHVLDEHTRERFLKEILVLLSIKHKNIVAAHKIVRYEDKDAYTMEYVDGMDLGSVIESGEKLDGEQIDAIMSQLLSAVAALHKKGIIHRDIKPENIMLRKDGVIKLNDLGLVKILSDNPKTDPGLILGTAHYLAPEYILAQDIGTNVDLYACGMILWELVNGDRRFKETNPEIILPQLINSGFKHPYPKGAKRKYRYILDKALAKNETLRFKTAEEMKAAFKGHKFQDVQHLLHWYSIPLYLTLILIGLVILLNG